MKLVEILIVLAIVLLIGIAQALAMSAQRTAKEDHTSRPKRQSGFRRTWRKLYLMPIGVHRLIGWLPGHRMSPDVQFCNIAEGTSVTGNKAYIPDAAISRYNLVKQGSDDVHVAVSAANTDIPLGVTTDEVATADIATPINVAVFGACVGTQRIALGGTVAAGDFLQSNGDGTAIKLKTTTGSWYKIGRALMAGVSGDTIEFSPCMPDLIVVP